MLFIEKACNTVTDAIMPSDPLAAKRKWRSPYIPKVAHFPINNDRSTKARIQRLYSVTDIVLGVCLEGYFVYSTPNLDFTLLVSSMYSVALDPSVTTFALHVASDQFATVMLTVLRILLWSTFVWRWKPLHDLWATKLIQKTKLMPGGFAPRASALCLGLLLFVSQTLVEERTISGSGLQKSRYWKARQTCLADHTIPSGLKSQYYFQGMYMEPPDGCFNTDPGKTNNIWSSQPPFELADTIPVPDNLVSPFYNGTKILRTDRQCRYLCLNQRNVEIATILQKLGIITAGAAVAITVSDSFTQRVGWRLVDEDTTPEQLRSLLRKGCLKSTGFPGSAIACGLQVELFFMISTYVSVYILGKTSVHSVDFKVNYVIVSGLIIASMQRWWNPMTLRPIVYTKKLWRDGEDQFLVLAQDDDGSTNVTLQKIDLYRWIHTHQLTRALFLMRYSMRVDTEENKSVGTPVRCILRCTEHILDRQGSVVSIQGQHLNVVCREQVTIPVNATGVVIKSRTDQADQMVIRWDPPISAETLMNENNLAENTEEWEDVADELAAIIMQEGGENQSQENMGELGRRLTRMKSHRSVSDKAHHGLANDLLWGITGDV